MKWRLRLITTLAGVAVSMALGVPTASADLVFDETAQEAFGVDADGNLIPDSTAPMRDAWEALLGTEEGRRILDAMEAATAVVEIKVLPASEVAEGSAYGTAQGFDWVDGIPGRVEIKISGENHKGRYHAGDTIYHELRHGEIFLGGPSFEVRRNQHDRLHAGDDALYERFKGELNDYVIGALEADTLGVRILEDSTPIFDSIKARADDQARLGFDARELGYLFDSSDPPPAPEVEWIDVEGVTRVRFALQGLDGSPIVGPACGGEKNGRRVLCADGESDLGGDDILGIGIEFGSDLEFGVDTTFELKVDLDTDGLPDNDREGVDSQDPARGTDATYGVRFDSEQGWRFTLDGVDLRSAAAAIIEGDTATLLIPMDEIPGGGDAGFRVSASLTSGGTTSTDVFEDSVIPELIGIPGSPVPAGCAGGVSPLGPPCDSRPETHVTSAQAYVDQSGFIWIELGFEQPWTAIPPSDLFSFGIVWGIALGSEDSSLTRWSVHDGLTEGLGVVGFQVTKLDAYLTPTGGLAARIPGAGTIEGYAGLLGHHQRPMPGSPGHTWGPGEPLVVITHSRHMETATSPDPIPRTSGFVISIDEFLGNPPLDDWIRVEVDVGPVTLEIPGG